MVVVPVEVRTSCLLSGYGSLHPTRRPDRMGASRTERGICAEVLRQLSAAYLASQEVIQVVTVQNTFVNYNAPAV